MAEQEKQSGPMLPIYNLNVPGEDNKTRQTKGIDVYALNAWIEEKKRETSMMLADPKKVPDGTTFHFVQADVFQQMIIELDMTVKGSLGLLSAEEPEGKEQEEPEVPDTKGAPDVTPNPAPQSVSLDVEASKQQPDSEFFGKEEGDSEPKEGEVVL